ncbi:MAG: four helix bundle protein [Patescibacteria group bacterium]
MMIKSYKDLLVWQVGIELVIATYELTEQFPKKEQFGLTSQIRRASISIPSNVAEGYQRKTDGELLRFLLIALGSASELETQLFLAKKLKMTSEEYFLRIDNLLTRVLQLTNSFINKLRKDTGRTANRGQRTAASEPQQTNR